MTAGRATIARAAAAMAIAAASVIAIAIPIAGCGPGDVVIVFHVDTPAPGSDAYPFDGLEDVTLSVSRDADSSSIVEITFQRGDAVSVPDMPFGEDLLVRLRGHEAGFEVSYGRTCPFDFEKDGAAIEPHIWFSRIGTWASAPQLPEVGDRRGGVAFTAPDGSGVFVGGATTGEGEGDVAVDTIDRFDTAAGVFGPLAATSAARLGSRAAVLGDGRAILVGGVNAGGNAVPFYEVIDADPTAPAVRQVEHHNDARLRLSGHAVVSLADGSALVVGGAAQAVDGDPFLETDAAWRVGLDATGAVSIEPSGDRLAIARRDHTATRIDDLLGGHVLVVGGRDALGPIGAAEIYAALGDDFLDPVGPAPSLITPRWGHVAARLPDGTIAVAGGVDGAGAPVSTVEVYLPHLATFREAGVLPAGAGLTEATLTPLPDGSLLYAGGRDAKGVQVATAVLIKLGANEGELVIVETDPLEQARAAHAATLLCDGTVLVVGGAGTTTAERYNPTSQGR